MGIAMKSTNATIAETRHDSYFSFYERFSSFSTLDLSQLDHLDFERRADVEFLNVVTTKENIGCEWHFFSLSNGGFYIQPVIDGPQAVFDWFGALSFADWISSDVTDSQVLMSAKEIGLYVTNRVLGCMANELKHGWLFDAWRLFRDFEFELLCLERSSQ
jgi:hypothetical protein